MTTARKLVVVANQVQPQQCSLYRSHSCAVLNNHHRCPKSWFEAAGQPIVTPMSLLCPNCHSNTHAALDALIAGRDVSALPPRCVALARQGLDIAKLNGLTPARTL